MRSYFSASLKVISCLTAMFVLTGCINVLREFGNKSSDDYLIYQARQQLDSEDYDGAIGTITPVVEDTPTNQSAAYILAAAYAGRAGLRVLDVLTNIAQQSSEKTLFEIFAEHMVGADDEAVEDLESATTVLDNSAADAADRSSELNLFAVFVYYARIGVNLARYAYDSTGTQYTNFTACHKAEDLNGAKTGIPDDSVDIVMTSIPRIVSAIANVTVQGAAVDALRSAEFLDSLSEDPIPCSANSNNVNCLAVRTFINVGLPDGIGLGTGSQFTPGGLCLVTTP